MQIKPLTFAVFHAELTAEAKSNILKVEPCFVDFPAQQLIEVLFASIRRFHPHCRTAILTDLKTEFPISPESDLFRYDLDTNFIGLSRTKAQVAFLKQRENPGSVIFLDYDMLVQGDLNPLFNQPFDVALTYRAHITPINGGVIIIHENGFDRGLAFMEKVLKISLEKPRYYAWYGNQRALLRAIGIDAFFKRKSDTLTIGQTHILLLPCSLYNFSTEDDQMEDYYPDKKILHFKGARKPFLLPYFEKYIKQNPC